MMGCVTSPSFSICINGKSYGHIIPSKGLRQGDLCPLICFCYVQKALQHCSLKQSWKEGYMAYRCAGELQVFPTYCLQTIPCYFARPIRKKSMLLTRPLNYMKMHLANVSTLRSLQFSLVATLRKHKEIGLSMN